MKTNVKLTTAMILFASVMVITASFGEEPKPLIPICPAMTEEKLQTLADQGKVSLSDKTYNLVTQSETHNNYNGRLIETKEKLTDFLKETKAKPTVTLNINSHQNPMMRDHQKPYCAYMLERDTEEFVIALMPSSEDQKK